MLGLIAAFHRLNQGPEFDTEDERLLLSFAASAATAVATAQSVAEVQLRQSITASERERTRWARELHDEALQGLGALRVMLSSAARRGSTEHLQSAVSAAVDELATEISKLRSLIAELRPTSLDELGLSAALESLVSRQSSTSGSEIDADIALPYETGDREGRLDAEIESAVYRVVQEALTNVAKHARAERVELQMVENDGHLEILIRDDGVGFDPSQPSEGFGLVGMRERVALVNGTLNLASTPGSGTELKVRVPIVLREHSSKGSLAPRSGP